MKISHDSALRCRPVTDFAALLLGAIAGACNGSTVIAVSTTADGQSGSLRAAIGSANSADPRRPIRLEIPAGNYDLKLCGADDTNAAGDLDITTDAAVALVAPSGASVVIRQTCANERVLDSLGTGRLTLVGVTITGGSVQGTAQLVAQGGGVRAQGDVTLEQATISGNTLKWSPLFTQSAPAAQGGGLYVGGSLASTGSIISGNSAAGGPDAGQECCGITEGGGAYVRAAITMTAGAVSNNSALGTLAGLARGGGLAQASGSTGPITLSGVTFASNTAQGGSASRSAAIAGDGIGGALAVFGPLTASNVTCTGNKALGGDASDQSGSEAGAGTGGAIAGESTVEIRSSTFSTNRARSGNAPVFSATQGLYTRAARGGAVWGGGNMTLSQSTFDANVAEEQSGFLPSPPTRGGAVRGESALSVNGGQFTNNTAFGSGGALSGGAVSLADVTFTANMIHGLSIEGVYTNSAGGGAVDAATLTAQHITASDNKVDFGFSGGALFVAGDATVEESVIRNNSVTFVRSYYDPEQAGGGGVYAAGKLVISSSMLLGNGGSLRSAPSRLCGSTCPGVFAGGGAWAGSIDARNVTAAQNYTLSLSDAGRQAGGGAFGSSGDVTLVNTTLSGNLASAAPDYPSSSARAAAVLAGALSLEHITALDNEGVVTTDPTQLATAPRAPLASLAATSLTTHRSVVVAPSGARVCTEGTQVSSSADSSYDWFSDSSCNLSGAGDKQSTAGLVFAALADNGGPVQTRLPAAGGAIIDYIPTSDCPIASDARGVTRPQGPACDVGAVELAQ